MKNIFNTPRYIYGFDLVFSYWIFAWYILYICGAPISNPKLALLCGIVVNTIQLCSMIFILRKSSINIILFILVNICIKIIPYYTLHNISIDFSKDVYILLCVFGVYLVWLYINGINIKNVIYDHAIHPMTRLILTNL